jgi:hypothetical protein
MVSGTTSTVYPPAIVTCRYDIQPFVKRQTWQISDPGAFYRFYDSHQFDAGIRNPRVTNTAWFYIKYPFRLF